MDASPEIVVLTDRPAEESAETRYRGTLELPFAMVGADGGSIVGTDAIDKHLFDRAGFEAERTHRWQQNYVPVWKTQIARQHHATAIFAKRCDQRRSEDRV